MRQFIIVLCLWFIGVSKAQNGYNYVPPVAPAPPAVHTPPAHGVPLFNHQQALPLLPVPQVAQIPLPDAQYGPPQAPYQSQGQNENHIQKQSFSHGQAQSILSGHQNNYQSGNYQQFVQPQRQQIITKDIYIHSAPEDQEESLLGDDYSQNAPIRKNYRIVFIKAPSTNLKLAANALKYAQAANEEKTVIYVLSKKPDLSAVQNQLQQVQSEQVNHKPEVYFIKYKTQEEAARAQQEIQAQYDALGGSTRVSDEGYAPVTSVANLQVGGHGGFNQAIPISSYARSAQQNFAQPLFQPLSTGVGVDAGVNKPAPGYLPAKSTK